MDLLANLNEPQCRAVRHVEGPLLVLAGAGSGKTRVITRRVAHLITQGIDPYNVLAITFTNKAAGEMRERVAELNTPPGTTVCTFHALCARLLREFAEYVGLDRNYTIYDRNDQLKVAKEAIESLNLAGASLAPAKVHAVISNAKNELQTPHAYANAAGDFFSRNVAAIYHKYEQQMAANNALDFDDLLMRVAFLLRDNPDIRQYLADRYRYVLIDEYQDTNHAQYIIAHTIAMGHKNICVTGDPDQSIYAWRGADITNILEFEKDYPAAEVIALQENYRSVQPILSAASNLIANNTMRKDKTLFAARQGGDKVRTVLVDDEHAEAWQVADRVESLRIAGVPYGQMAVFYRVNSLSRVLEDAFMRKGVPYVIARGVEFYNRKEIKDMLAYLKVLVNPSDDICCMRIINTPARGIGATTIKRLRNYAGLHGLSILAAAGQVEQVGLSAAPTKKVRAFADMMTALAGKIDQPVRHIFNDVYSGSGLEEAYHRGDEDSRQAKANIEELITSAAEFDERKSAGGLAEYLLEVSLVSDLDHMEGSGGAVTLMTLHAAKGLEFPAVFMVGCEEGMLPFVRGQRLPGESENPQEIEEERRLCFVGMTRAMDHLTLSSARARMVRGQRLPATASRFLSEIGEDDVSTEDLTTNIDRSRSARRRGGFVRQQQPDEERKVIERMNMDDFAGSGHDEAGGHDEHDEHETPIPPEYEYLKPGCMVRHPKFGLGKLVKLSQRWPDTRATILFHEYGQKKIVLARTTLQIEEPQW